MSGSEDGGEGDAYRVTCSNCGFDVFVDGGKHGDYTTAKKSAEARRAGHIGSVACSADDVTVTEVEP